MALIKPYIDQLLEDRDTLAENISAKGVEVGEDETITSLAKKVADIGYRFTGHCDAEGLAQIGWTADDIAYYQNNGVGWDEDEDFIYKLTATELAGDDTRFIPKNTTRTNFNGFRQLLGVPELDVSEATSLANRFKDCCSLKAVNNLIAPNCTNIDRLFYNCYSLNTLSNIDLRSATGVTIGSSAFYACDSLSKLKNVNLSSYTTQNPFFQGKSLTEIYNLDISSCTTGSFYGCPLLKAENINASSFTTAQNFFGNCGSLQRVKNINLSGATDASYPFQNCYNLKIVEDLDLRNTLGADRLFYCCYNLTTVKNLRLDNVQVLSWSFMYCRSLSYLDELEGSHVINMSNLFNECRCLTYFGGLKNLGQAYDTEQSASYSNYTLDLTYSSLLTHDSLMNIINNLYDIATAGVQPQKLALGSTNKAKLTAEEIAIATDKGWLVS